MRWRLLVVFLLLSWLILINVVSASAQTSSPDWLVSPIHAPVRLEEHADNQTVTLSNGLISRTFQISPNLATISLRLLQNGEEFVRGIKPEAILEMNSRIVPVGGLLGQPDYAYLDPAWLNELKNDSMAFQFAGYSTARPQERFPWKRKRYSANLDWPPKGLTVTFTFKPSTALMQRYAGLEVKVHYEMYEGLPLLAKWITLYNGSQKQIVLNRITTELLAIVERESAVSWIRNTRPRKFPNDIEPNDLAQMTKLRVTVQSDYAFCGGSSKAADQTTFWRPDDQYETQVDYDRTWPHLLTCRYPYGPDVVLNPGESFDSFRTFILLHDSDDYERQGLAIRRMYRALAPWCTENPILMHLRNADSESIRRAVDQCVQVGFEMIILSFGSGLDMENEDPAYLAQLMADFDYAHSKGIEIGGYSLLASRSAGAEFNVIDPKTGKPGAYFGNSPCLVSTWGNEYFRKIKKFIETTGADILEHDGSYPGDVCASTHHGGHRGLMDSQWAQFKQIQEFYHWCRARGVYLNVPDWYFLNGSNKTAMGYRETNWSLPRALQIIHGRQNIYDGTWEKTPSMGWMFVPLVEYQGGGAAATLEPLREHLDAYEAHLAQNFGSGVQACYRGPRLYDSEETKAVVKKWVDFYKKHRAILDSDIIHVRRTDGRDIDCILHANPQLGEKGLAMVYNPLDQEAQRTLALPLYYTGLSSVASISEQDSPSETYQLDRNYRVHIPVKIPAKGLIWLVIR